MTKQEFFTVLIKAGWEPGVYLNVHGCEMSQLTATDLENAFPYILKDTQRRMKAVSGLLVLTWEADRMILR